VLDTNVLCRDYAVTLLTVSSVLCKDVKMIRNNSIPAVAQLKRVTLWGTGSTNAGAGTFVLPLAMPLPSLATYNSITGQELLLKTF
jgi:hypothetical protein